MLNNKREKKRSSSTDKRTFAKAGHMCMVCGFRATTKNKYRELQDHLVRQHFQERIKAALPTRRPFVCPDSGCNVEGKDWQALMRHYTGKHGILESYLKEVIAQGLVNKAYRENMKKPRVSALNPVLDDYILSGGGGGSDIGTSGGGSDKENSTSPVATLAAAKRPTRVQKRDQKRKKRPSEASSNNDSSSSSSGGDVCPMSMLPSDMLLDEGNNNKILTGTIFNQDLPQPPLTVQLAAPTTLSHPHSHPHHQHHQVVPTNHLHPHALVDPVMAGAGGGPLTCATTTTPTTSASDDDHQVEIDDSEMAENPTHLALVLKRQKLDPSSGLEMPPEESYAFVDLKYFKSISANQYIFKGYEDEMMMDSGLMAADNSSYTTLPPMQQQHPQCHMQTVLPPSVDGYQHLYQPSPEYLDTAGYPPPLVATDAVASATSPSFYSGGQQINIVSPSQYHTNAANNLILPPDAIVTPCSGAPLLTLPPTTTSECMPQHQYILEAGELDQAQHHQSESRIDLGQIVRQTIETNQGLGPQFELQQTQPTYFPMEAAADGTTLVATAPMEAAEAALVMNTQEVVSTEEVVSIMTSSPSKVVVEQVPPIETEEVAAAAAACDSAAVTVCDTAAANVTVESSSSSKDEPSKETEDDGQSPQQPRELSDDSVKQEFLVLESNEPANTTTVTAAAVCESVA